MEPFIDIVLVYGFETHPSDNISSKSLRSYHWNHRTILGVPINPMSLSCDGNSNMLFDGKELVDSVSCAHKKSPAYYPDCKSVTSEKD